MSMEVDIDPETFEVIEPVECAPSDTIGSACNVLRQLNYEEVVELLTNTSDEHCTCWPPSKPKNGDIFIFTYEDEKHHFDFVADCMQWRNQGTRVYNKDGSVVKKRYYQRRIGRQAVDFRKCVYEISNVNRVLIHYLGPRDEEVPEAPHGNRKKHLDKSHVRVMPSVLADIKENKDSVGEIYMKMVADCRVPPQNFKVAIPRNMKQVDNGKQYEKKKEQVDKCDPGEIHSLLQLNTELGGVVKYLAFVPAVNVILINEQLMQEWMEIVSTGERCLISIVTGLKFRDYHVTTLLAQHQHFEENPGFPFAYLIHQRNNMEAYKLLLKEVRQLAPGTNAENIVFVTNKDPIVLDALHAILPNVNHFVCWDELKRVANNMLRKLKIHGGHRKKLLQNIEYLMDCDTDAEHDAFYTEFKLTWFDEFAMSYESQLREAVQSSIKGKLQRQRMYTDTIGLTHVPCDGLDLVQNGLAEWAYPTLSAVAVALYMLGSYYQTEMTKSFGKVGKYKLRRHYTARHIKMDDMQLPIAVTDPADIVRIVQNKREMME